MASEWFVQVRGTEVGPLGAGELRQLARQRRFATTDLVRKGKDGRWIAAAEIEGLFDDVARPPPAIAPAVIPPASPSTVAVVSPMPRAAPEPCATAVPGLIATTTTLMRSKWLALGGVLAAIANDWRRGAMVAAAWLVLLLGFRFWGDPSSAVTTILAYAVVAIVFGAPLGAILGLIFRGRPKAGATLTAAFGLIDLLFVPLGAFDLDLYGLVLVWLPLGAFLGHLLRRQWKLGIGIGFVLWLVGCLPFIIGSIFADESYFAQITNYFTGPATRAASVFAVKSYFGLISLGVVFALADARRSCPACCKRVSAAATRCPHCRSAI